MSGVANAKEHIMKLFVRTAAVVSVLAMPQAIIAEPLEDQVIDHLQGQGFTRIEVKTGLTQIKVEAVRGNREVEIIYDSATGRILKQEVNRVDAGDDTAPGIERSREARDFVRVNQERRDDRRDDRDERRDEREEDRDERRDDREEDRDDRRDDREDEREAREDQREAERETREERREEEREAREERREEQREAREDRREERQERRDDRDDDDDDDD